MTDTEEIEDLVKSYVNWMKDKTVIHEVSSNWIEITTPFLDYHNDALQIYAKKSGDKYILTDDGYILSDLEISGYNIDTPKRAELIQDILKIWQIEKKDGVLSVRTSKSDFPSRKNDLVRAMMELSGLQAMSEARVYNYFLEDVATWIIERDISATRNVRIQGKSGIYSQIDFLIPGKKFSETALQVVTKPTMQSLLAKVALILTDVMPNRSNMKLATIINDDGAGKKSMERIAKYAGSQNMGCIPWSEKDKIDQLCA